MAWRTRFPSCPSSSFGACTTMPTQGTIPCTRIHDLLLSFVFSIFSLIIYARVRITLASAELKERRKYYVEPGRLLPQQATPWSYSNDTTISGAINSTSGDDNKIYLKFCIHDWCRPFKDCFCCQMNRLCYRLWDDCRAGCPACNPRCPPLLENQDRPTNAT